MAKGYLLDDMLQCLVDYKNVPPSKTTQNI